MAKRPPKREWALINVSTKSLVLKGGKPIIINAVQPPRGEDFSNKYRKAGYDYASVEIEYSTKHVGEPRYLWRDDQKAIVTKIIAITGE
jgi:hypothetical protein